MGLFDAFTGAPMKEAAEKNRQLFAGNETKGLGYLDTGYQAGTSALQSGIGAFTPLAQLGQQYGQGAAAYGDAAGANGADGMMRARAQFTSSPGYAEGLESGLDQLDRRQAGRGMLASGNTNLDTIKYAGDYANQKYNQYVQNLNPYIGAAASTIGGAATGQAAGYGGLANLASGDAQNRVNLGTTTASGMAGANSAEAQAKMQGSSNLWGLGMGLASMAAGGFGGLGGLGGGGAPQMMNGLGAGAGNMQFPMFR